MLLEEKVARVVWKIAKFSNKIAKLATLGGAGCFTSFTPLLFLMRPVGEAGQCEPSEHHYFIFTKGTNNSDHVCISPVTSLHYITSLLHSSAAFMMKPCYLTAAAEISPSAHCVHYPVVERTGLQSIFFHRDNATAIYCFNKCRSSSAELISSVG